MCGIVGGIAERNVTPILLEGLKRLEYRGYDSAGIAVIHQSKIHLVRRCGKVRDLVAEAEAQSLSGFIGIAHTRWATHGKPSEDNAHPQMSGSDLAIVHNGIIENYEVVKASLVKKGFKFQSQTDTEVIAHCLQDAYQKTKNLKKALEAAVTQLEGAYAIAVMVVDQPDCLMVARKGSPLVIGLGLGENFIASDILALLPVTQSFILLEEGDIATVYKDKIDIQDSSGQAVVRPHKQVNISAQATEKGDYRHYMQKEIFEQSLALSNALEGRLLDHSVPDNVFGARASEIFDKTKSIQIVACGTSYHAGLVGKYWLEALAGIPTQVEIASEFRYRKAVVSENTLLVVISQSGETADTLAALEGIDKKKLSGTLSICNVPESSIVRKTDCVLLTHAGPEIGVASTKAFTTQLVGLLLLTVVLGRRHTLSKAAEHALVQDLRSLPSRVEKILLLDAEIKGIVSHFRSASSALFLGRDKQVAIAMEGALKLKEISYIHAEAYSAGELKHGALALVDENMPVVVIVPNDGLLPKMKANIEEVRTREGRLILIVEQGVDLIPQPGTVIIEVPAMPNVLSPILMTIPLQLLAYHVAVEKGTDVDQPRNLAKSVTVE